jgi:uncharacterized protein
LLLTAVLTHGSDYEIGDRLAPAPGDAAGDYAEIHWDDLMPADWDPLEPFKGLDLYSLEDSDPRAIAALEKVREAWDAAPANEALAGRTGRIAGFLVPLDWNAREFREFLLVPYFGACIHTPPPPANQIIHVEADPPVRGLDMMEAVWVEGRLEIASTDTDMGRSGYRMRARSVKLYEW